MKINKTYIYGSNSYFGEIEEPTICPMCKHSIKPVQITLYPYIDEHENHFYSGFYLCQHCFQTFVTLNTVELCINDGSYSKYAFNSILRYTGPNRFIEKSFEERIKNLSPQFHKIYNQALAAESSCLDEIAGIGYRKAIEFLIKDYIISKDPDLEIEISKKPLMRCINENISDEIIKVLASRSVWIGNDETHYVKLHKDKDIDDLKTFIDAMVNYISMNLIFLEAEAMPPKK